MERLEKDVVRRLEKSLEAVDNVSTELSAQADDVRADIRQAGERTKEMVDRHVRHMIEEVDDLEESRHKIIDKQRDDLRTHLAAAKNAVRFSARIMKKTTQDEAVFSLLHALETRATSLLSTHIQEQPQHHSRLMFAAATDTDLACKTKEGVGKVVPCRASAKHSEIEGHTSHAVVKGEKVNVTIRAKDSNGEKVETGGDIISALATNTSADRSCGDANTPSTNITANGLGSDVVSCICPSMGRHRLVIFMNGEKMARDVQITCLSVLWEFDPNEHHLKISISADKRKALSEAIFLSLAVLPCVKVSTPGG